MRRRREWLFCVEMPCGVVCGVCTVEVAVLA